MIRKGLFFLLLFILPFQLGKHFFPPFSYLQGVRVDYLSPTIYLIDTLILLLSILNLKELLLFFRKKVFIFIFLLIAINIIFSQSKYLSLYGLLRMIEFFILIFLGKKIMKYLSPRSIVISFLSSGLIELFLCLLQFYNKSSIQGIFYFIGERLFTLSTPGIAKATINGIEFLRPYGSFSHPNSMAGFYLLIYFFVLSYKKFNKFIFLKFFSLSIFTLLIFISFSKVAIVTFLILNTTHWMLNTKIKCPSCKIARIFIPIAMSLVFLQAITDPLTIQKRIELLKNSWTIIIKHPLFGTGVNSYLLAQSQIKSNFYLFFNQPVHNIYLLFISEFGLISSGLFLYLNRKILGGFKKNSLLILSVVMITGLFDHYWITLVQNFYLIAVVFSISFQDRS